MTPISPDEITKAKAKTIMPDVFEVVNSLLAKHWTGTQAKINQAEVVKLLVARGYDPDRLFLDHQLDFESAYQDKGWKVEYDKPGYCETYDAFWIFRK